MSKRRYEEIEPIDRERALAALQGGDTRKRCHALLALSMHDPDWRFVQELALGILQAGDEPEVVATAVQALGNLARIHGQLDLERVLPVLQTLDTSHPYVAGDLNDAYDDFEIYLRFRR